MSVTVSNLLNLPSLRRADIIAGRGGLKEIVSSISVLAPPEAIPEDILFAKDEFYGGEIFITTYMGLQRNTELHCNRLRKLVEGGAAGIIVFCVGCVMQKNGQQILNLANELNFPVICMPSNYLTLRYTEIIRDVMEAVISDQGSEESFAIELLERATRLPRHQQTMEVVLKMISNRLRATVILTDSSFNALNEVTWPRTLSGVHEHLKDVKLPPPYGEPAEFPGVTGGLLYRAQVQSAGIPSRELFILSENSIKEKMLQHAAKTVQLAVQIWGQQHDSVAVSELLRAIMMDEPLKINRLANLFNINISSVNTIWVISPKQVSDSVSETVLGIVRKTSEQYCGTALVDTYEGHIVLLLDGADSLSETEDLLSEIFCHLPEGFTLTIFNNLNTPSDVRVAFTANQEYYRDARKIFPLRACFYGEDIRFVKECRNIIDSGEASVQGTLMAFSPLNKERNFVELKQTLAVYLLDTDFGVTETAKRMYLHRNTIKYRLKCMSDYFGFNIGRFPSSLELYRAVAVERLLISEKI